MYLLRFLRSIGLGPWQAARVVFQIQMKTGYAERANPE